MPVSYPKTPIATLLVEIPFVVANNYHNVKSRVRVDNGNTQTRPLSQRIPLPNTGIIAAHCLLGTRVLLHPPWSQASNVNVNGTSSIWMLQWKATVRIADFPMAYANIVRHQTTTHRKYHTEARASNG